MCYTSILPTTAKSNTGNAKLLKLIRIFNHWLKMLTAYGKLDNSDIVNDFTSIAKVIKDSGIKTEVKQAVRKCRDYALAEFPNVEDLTKYLISALEIMCSDQEDEETRIIKKHRADQGMTERYSPLTKRLKKEHIRKIDKELIYTDSHTDNAYTTKLIRRIVEKRAAQTVYKNSGKRDRDNNQFRQSVRRATSFSLYSVSFAEYDYRKRSSGTHWKFNRQNYKGKLALKAKTSYNSYEEAVEACNRFFIKHPDDPRPMTAYRCKYCGKWHIGHGRIPGHNSELDSEEFRKGNENTLINVYLN